MIRKIHIQNFHLIMKQIGQLIKVSRHRDMKQVESRKKKMITHLSENTRIEKNN